MYLGNKNIPFSVRLNRRQYDYIVESAKRNNLSSSALLSQIIDFYISLSYESEDLDADCKTNKHN